MIVTTARRRFRSTVVVIAFVLISCIGLLNVDDGIREHVLDLGRPAWFYVSGLTRYNFRPTPLEQACLNGSAIRINAPGLPKAIPKIVHFVTGVDKPNPISLITWLAVRAVAANLGPNVEIRLHHVFLSEDGPWWPDVRDRVKLVRHRPSFLDNFTHIVPPPAEWHAAHKADVLRLQILKEHGGIYLDTDVILLRSLDVLLRGYRDVVMGYEGGHRRGLCNAVVLAKKGAPFLQRWYRSYDNFNPHDWSYNSVLLPAKFASTYPDEICPLSPAAFFWPTWTADQVAWMHEPLNGDEVVEATAAIERNGGSLFPGQLAYHATGSARFMRASTPSEILKEDTRFNLLVRRFIDVK
ncbi:glycosyl transferase [Ophiocordyceps camponoti-floridani]|uniref:Glycosyl transferase n=1 Tax=Ophiocordyceps camponoti-floridani TaxID=2030778 RepID=A0A8H4QA75_9HYPO|nr:glycosyl transferase [Ophiocordyceps camponoti-floridani]